MTEIKTEEVSQAKLSSLIKGYKANAGIFSVEFTKINGDKRQMTCVKKEANPIVEKESNSYLTVFDVLTDDYRTINLNTINRLVMKTTIYKVV